MSDRSWPFCFLALPLLLASGCAELPLSDFGEAFAAAICEREARCCTPEERLSPTETECRADLRAQTEALEAMIVESVGAGRLRYDRGLAHDCFVAERARGCTDASTPAACDAMLAGLVPEGAACAHDHECAASCRPDANGDLVCQALGSAGEPCLADDHCAAHHYCEFFSTCTPTLPLGDPCDITSVCDDGLYCDLTATSPTCIAAPPACTGSLGT